MSVKRKDNKGRNLRDGESQRKNGSYDYRYIDLQGNRKSVYAATLDELRKKEAEIRRYLDAGIDTQANKITVAELLDRYFTQRQGIRQQTKQAYLFAANVIGKNEISLKKINSVKPSDAKLFLIQLYQQDMKFKTVSGIKSVLKLSFDMALEDGLITRNPFQFRLTDIIKNNSETKESLTEDERNRFLAYLSSSKTRKRYVDEVTILLKTGLRISELYGLQMCDVDFENRRIRVNKQLQLSNDGKYYIEKTKTQSGERFVPMIDDEVYQSFKNVFEKRSAQDEIHVVEGYNGFLFLTTTGKPKTSKNMEVALRRIVGNYNRTHNDALPNITPHVLRHTFCTELALSGVNVKVLQYIMGHSNVSTTLNIYTSINFDFARDELTRAAQHKTAI